MERFEIVCEMWVLEFMIKVKSVCKMVKVRFWDIGLEV